MDDPSTYYTPLRMSRPWTPGAVVAGGTAASLSGWSDANYIEHTTAADINNLPAFTVAMWLRTTSATARQAFSQKGNPGAAALREDLGTPTFECVRGRATTNGGADANLANFASYGTDKFLFFVWTFDDTTDANNKIYLGDLTTAAAEPSAYNTQLAGTGTLTDESANNWRVGRHFSVAGREFVGQIAEVWMFNKVLSGAEIAQLRTTDTINDTASIRVHSEYLLAAGPQPDLTGNGHTGVVTGTLTVDISRPAAS